MRLCVFPGDSLKTLYEKGEIKERYYNPKNFFDEVHFITFTDSEVEPEKVRAIVGDAKIFVHAIGKLDVLSIISKKKAVLDTVKKINPDVIRAFTPALHGYFAALCAKTLGIPFVLSIHGDFERDARYFFWKTGQYKNWLQSTFMKFFTEKYAIQNADIVICAYNFPVRYAKEFGAKTVEVVYNKVYAENFENVEPALKLDKPAVICVGRLIPEKNQECLIRAMVDIDAYLILIGNGTLYEYLFNLSKELNVEKKVLFFKAIPNKKLPAYYASAKIFALPIKYGGVAIPVIEAMAAGLPVVVARPELDPNPELASDVGLVIENTPQTFSTSINNLLSDENLRQELIAKGRKKFSEIEGNKMEEKEAKIYERVFVKESL